MLSLTIFIALISYSFGCNVAAVPWQQETAKLHIVSKENKTHSLLESFLIRDTEEDLVEDNVGKVNEDNDIPNILITITNENVSHAENYPEDILSPADLSVKPTKNSVSDIFVIVRPSPVHAGRDDLKQGEDCSADILIQIAVAGGDAPDQNISQADEFDMPSNAVNVHSLTSNITSILNTPIYYGDIVGDSTVYKYK